MDLVVRSFLKVSLQSSKSRCKDPNLGWEPRDGQAELLEPSLVLQPVGDRHLLFFLKLYRAKTGLEVRLFVPVFPSRGEEKIFISCISYFMAILLQSSFCVTRIASEYSDY